MTTPRGCPRRAHYPYSDEALLQYLDTLDWVLDDSVIADSERSEMNELASQLGISIEQQNRAHSQYLNSIILAARRDDVITQAERELIEKVASALAITDVEIPDETPSVSLENIASGARICFTGTAVFISARSETSAESSTVFVAGHA